MVDNLDRNSPSARLTTVLKSPLALEDVDAPDTLVPRIDAQDFVRVARALRDENRLDLLLGRATAEQLTSLMDLDAWQRDRVDVPQARTWVMLLARLYQAMDKPRGALIDLVYSMDPEMWTMALLPGTQVIILDHEDDQSRDFAHGELDELRTWDSPDGFFVVGVSDDDFGQQALATIELIYQDNLDEGRKLLLSIQSGMHSQIEEDLRRWREGRLADLGFVAWEEAMKLFTPFDRTAAATEEPRDFRYLEDPDGMLALPRWQTSGLLARVLERLGDTEHGQRAREFLLLVSEVMAAQRFPPGDTGLQERAIHQTQATISLGLELLLTASTEHPDPEAFLAERVVAIGLRDIFRVGYGALEKLRKATAQLGKATRVSLTGPGSLLDRPWGPSIASLSAWYPELPIMDKSAATRPLQTFADVRQATALVAQSGALSRLAFASEGFAIDPVWLTRSDSPEQLVLGDLIRTAIVHIFLPGSRGSLAPLTPDDLDWASKNLVERARLTDPVRRDFSARCDALGIGEHTSVLATNLLTRLEVELHGLERNEEGQVDLSRTRGFLTIQDVGMWLTARHGVGEEN
ncbi:MAG: hypothetical protein KUG77_28045 [Nannocystaceae bacterium]|nr:hypothetical protein [Nannocystaceae bacterium]